MGRDRIKVAAVIAVFGCGYLVVVGATLFVAAHFIQKFW